MRLDGDMSTSLHGPPTRLSSASQESNKPVVLAPSVSRPTSLYPMAPVATKQLKEHFRKPMANKARVVSMPPALNCTGSSSIYSHRTSRFSGTGSPPIIDFTEWADNYRGQRFGLNVIHEFPFESRNVGIHALLSGDNSAHSGDWRIDYEVLMDALRLILEPQGVVLEDYLDPAKIADLHRRDRECVVRLSQSHGVPNIDGVIGKPLAEVFVYASLPLIIAGAEHFLPTIVVKCVDELYRTGLYQPQLFRKTPNFGRVEHLVEVYDHLELPSHIHIARRRSRSISHHSSITAFGAQTSLHLETTENICALLRTFLQYLPEPILSPFLFDAIWNLCDIGKEVSRVSFDAFSPQGPMSMNRAASSISPEELRCIHTAQILIHLLPTPNFSLLVYLLSFFSQVVMVSEENGLAIQDVGSMFGSIMFGGHTEGRKDMKVSRGDIMLQWFLQRWKQVYNGLLPYDDDGPSTSKSKIMGKPPSVAQAPDGSANIGQPMSGYFDESTSLREECEVNSAAKDDTSLASTMLSHPKNGLSSESTVPTHYQPVVGSLEEPTLKYFEDVWPHLTPELRMKLNERMLDLLLEPLLSSNSHKMTRHRSNSVPSRIESSFNKPLPSPALQRQLDSSNRQVTHLERVVNESQRLLQETWDENDRLRQDKAALEMQLKALEAELKLCDFRYKDHEKKLRRKLEGEVEDVVKERDQVRDVVSEIQRISGAVGDRSGEWSRN